MKKFYLTHYEDYPIYEPAEGGYYYPGTDYSEYYECDTREEAKAQLAEMKEDLEANGWEVYEDIAVLYTKYIGEGQRWVIEEILGAEVSGRHPYE